MSHSTKAWAVLASISLTLIVLGHTLLGREGLMIGLILSLGINCYVYFYEDQRIVKLFRGKLLEGQDPWGVLILSRRLAARMRVPIPRIIILNNPSPQTLVVGRSLTHGTIVITEGLLQKLEPDEIEAVLAYSMACIKNLNTLAFSVASFIANFILFFTGLMDATLRILLVEQKKPNQRISQVFTRLAAPLVGFLVRMAVRPNSYLQADQTASTAIEAPKNLAKALWKLHSYSNTVPCNAQLALSHMYIVNPLTQYSWNKHFNTQPEIERRIRGLVGYYPL